MEPTMFNRITEGLQSFATWATSITIIVAALSAVCKPVRNVIRFVFNRLWDKKDKNKEIIERINNVESALSREIDSVKTTLSGRIQEVSDRNDEDTKDNIRWTILDFANSCRNGRRHTRDEYEHMFRLADKYEKLLKPDEKNSYFAAEYEYIKDKFAENDFL